MGKFFYRQIEKGLEEELEYRKKIFSSKSDDFYNFLSSPYVKLIFRRRFDGEEFVIDNSNKDTINDVYDFSFKNIPNPTFQSISIYNEGRYGSIRKTDISIKLYHIRQLNELESFLMIPGNTVIIQFGLSYYTKELDEKYNYYNLTLETKIHNFNYSFEGSDAMEFNISTMGEGLFAGSLDLNTKLDKKYIRVDSTDEEKQQSNNLMSYIQGKIDNLSLSAFDGYDEDSGICRYRISANWDYETEGDFDFVNNSYIWYITLNGIIRIINYMLEDRSLNIKYDGNAISTYDKNIISADPTEIVFPDSKMGNYKKSGNENGVKFANFGEIPKIERKFRNGDEVNLGYVLISLDFISQIVDEITNEDEDENVPVRKFLNKIFNSIYENSGNIYSLTLTLTQDEDVDDKNGILDIKDENYIDDSEAGDTPYVFETMNRNNILKTFSISSEIPDKMSTAMYIGGSSSKNMNPRIYDFITRDAEKTYYNPNIPNPVYSIEEWEKMKRSKKVQDTKKDIEFYADKIAKNGVDSETKNSLRSALKSYMSLNTDAKWNENVMYPIELSITLHGIVGFRFGDIITIDYLPERYLNHKEIKIVFMVTKINHNIEGNEWVTELETQCRMRPK